MRKKLLIISVITIFLAASLSFAIYYLNTYYLPQKVKFEITKTLSDKLNSIVKLEDIRFNLLKGIVIHNLEILNKKDSSLILKIGNASASLLILPSFNQKKIIIPTINIEDLSLNIIRYQDNKFNILDLIPKQENTNKSPQFIPFLIYRINIANSHITFLDKTIRPNLKQTLKISNFKAQPTPFDINFGLQATLINDKQTGALELSGKYQFSSKELKITSRLKELDALPYLLYFKNLPAEIRILNIDNINIEGALIKDKLSLKIELDIKNASIAKDKTLLSNAQAKLKASGDINLKDKTNLNYLLNIDDLKANLVAKEFPEKISIRYAKLKILPDRLEIQNLKLNTLSAAAEIAGNLENFLNPVFNINLKSDFDLRIAKYVLSDYFDFFNSVSLEGKATMDATLSKLKDKNELNFDGSLHLKDASLKTNNNTFGISAVNGLINFDNKNAGWTNLSFRFLDETFNSKAVISNPQSPLISLELNSDNINIKTKINSPQKNIFNMDLLEAKYFKSNINATGTLEVAAADNYHIDLTINSNINLNDLGKIKILPKDVLSKIQPQGECKIVGSFKGNIKKPKLLNISLELTSEELKFYNLRFRNFQTQISQQNKKIRIPQSLCKFYGGSISLNGIIDLEKERLPYAFKIISSDIDLSLLIQDTPLKDKTFAGILNSTLILSGPFLSFLDVKGQGNLTIRDGYLWEFDPLKKLGNFLFIPRYQALIFRQATADFSIDKKKAYTDNLALNSDIILLDCEGSIDFAGNLDFEIAPKLAPEAMKNSGRHRGIFNQDILAGISVVKLTGTIKEPKITSKIVVEQVLDKVKEGIKGTAGKLKGIMDLIFGSPE